MNLLSKLPNPIRLLSAGALVWLLAACVVPAAPATDNAATDNAATDNAAAEPIYLGVSGPLTGQNARYGEQWKKGFDLALEEINGAGGVNRRPLAYIFEDSQSDPTQSVVVAQKFVADPRIIVELGDFSSGASMAASPIYQRGGLVQYGALIVQQLRQAGIELPVVGTGSLLSPDFLKLGGDAVEGVYTESQFLPSDTRPQVKTVVDAYVAKYNETPDFFAIHAYDTLQLIAKAIEIGGPTRQGVHDALPQLKDVPSVIYGTANFDLETQRVIDPTFVQLQVVGGEFVLWDGSQPGAQ